MVAAATLASYIFYLTAGPKFPGYAFVYLIAIMLAARSGYGPGLLACALCFFAVPRLVNHNFNWHNVDAARVIMTAMISVLMSRMMSYGRISAQQNKIIERQNRELSRHVDELSEQSQALATAHGALEAVLNAATQTGIVGIDSHATITLFNTGAEAILGYAAADVIGARRFSEFIEGEVRDLHGESVLPVDFGSLIHALNESPFLERDVILTRHDGRRLIANLSLTAQRDPGGPVRGYVAVLRDITELRRNEAATLEAMKAAEAAAKSRSEFLATMSHEIRTPLNGVIGMTGLLLDTALLPEQREYATTIRNSGEALLAIINDILDFSKIEAGKLELEDIEFDLHTTVEECAEIIAAAAHGKGLELVLPVRPSSSFLVRGDQGRVRQILLNLLSNAVKFTSSGEVVTTIAFADEGPGAVVATIEVSDTGVGIAPEAQSRLFQAFSQADASTTRKFGGTGLGLAISKRLVELMGGRIGVSSRPGEGSTFWFTIRFAVVQNSEASDQQLSGKRLLVVDDNATNRRVLELQLERQGCLVRLAQDAAEALAYLHESGRGGEPFDAVLTDQCMPEMDGVELARAIRSTPEFQNVPILLLSSRGEGREEMGNLGISGILLKPVREVQLIRALRALLTSNALSGQRISPTARQDVKAGGRILVAEDNPVNQRVVALMLKKLGYSPEVVANGAEAVHALRLANYTAVLMDCHMPEMDGFEATQIIRRTAGESAATPIIALTANAFPGEREKCIAAGMNDYLAKPLNMELLSQRLRKFSQC